MTSNASLRMSRRRRVVGAVLGKVSSLQRHRARIRKSWRSWTKFIITCRQYISLPVFEQFQSVEDLYNERVRLIQEQGKTVFDYQAFSRRRRSDVVYILGSGPSINEISDRQWATIAEEDSIGFNLFFAHDFVPTFYHMEFTPENYSLVAEIWRRKKQYPAGMPLLVNSMHVDLHQSLGKYELSECTQFTVPRSASQYGASNLNVLLSIFRRRKALEERGFYSHYRGSLDLIVSMMVLLGYRKIVLLGIDLVDLRYFFHDADLYPSPEAAMVRQFHLHSLEKSKASGRLKQCNRTFDPSVARGYLTIDVFLKLYYEMVMQPLGVTMSIASRQSPMARFLPFERI